MKKVEITSDAYLACLIHAMSTEREEVMGLLLGEVSEIPPFTLTNRSLDPALVEHRRRHTNLLRLYDAKVRQTFRQGGDITRATVGCCDRSRDFSHKA